VSAFLSSYYIPFFSKKLRNPQQVLLLLAAAGAIMKQ